MHILKFASYLSMLILILMQLYKIIKHASGEKEIELITVIGDEIVIILLCINILLTTITYW